MKRAGELLSAFLDEELLNKAKGYHDLFSSWKAMAGDHIGAHSRIVELERSVLLIEADHPGWIQILQMKQENLLNTVRRRFPKLSITGISFRLSRDPERDFADTHTSSIEPAESAQNEQDTGQTAEKTRYENIKNIDFKETLMRLEQSISEKKRGC